MDRKSKKWREDDERVSYTNYKLIIYYSSIKNSIEGGFTKYKERAL